MYKKIFYAIGRYRYKLERRMISVIQDTTDSITMMESRVEREIWRVVLLNDNYKLLGSIDESNSAQGACKTTLNVCVPCTKPWYQASDLVVTLAIGIARATLRMQIIPVQIPLGTWQVRSHSTWNARALNELTLVLRSGTRACNNLSWSVWFIRLWRVFNVSFISRWF